MCVCVGGGGGGVGGGWVMMQREVWPRILRGC